MSELAVQMKGIKKSFGGVHALKHVDLNVKKGSIHAVIGENGAGKSTLMKVISGIHEKDGGQMLLHGKSVNFRSPKESLEKGIGIVHQELALCPDLTVAENMFLGDLGFGSFMINESKMNSHAKAALDQLGFAIDPKDSVGKLSVAYQQMVEIAKCLAKNVSVLILDEPTAVLSEREIELLFEKLREFRDKGVAILYISHRLEEIFRLCDAITVIKDGETVTELDPKTCTENDIISNMVGREMTALFPVKGEPTDEVVLEIENLSTKKLLKNINMTVKKGEIVGLAGLVGSGRTEIAKCLFGIDDMQTGIIRKKGKVLKIRHPAHAIEEGIGMVPESRKEQGAILSRPIRENITLANLTTSSRIGIIFHQIETKLSETLKRSLQIKLGSIEDPISSLSGGNQQKVVIAKWLNTECDVLILDEPTRGVDVGAKAEIYNVIKDLTMMGYAVIVISSEMPEIIGLCHRTYTMCDGEMTGMLSGDEMTEQNIMRLCIPKR
ncbi:sugar ABC transporter ATP-binding protein [Thorsellia anophelis]|uniref:Monosaccharide ABC transporter ATP-binding protein, CUT2 family (TC 3.A.1.2.-) n=1 Tax=Thorsellia anophelis DSM 18579 TaxID=1123402 RepID=A0A1I0F6H6_9GAMM|nr:sugar ABC transporter ATP-binding protein [Thorsellia anophelis]SET53470.1 monosaccharide ABC transporter ATP-binding protein, CUT2 family (TC 3.A.1.2.-) [Thorsellia anophelis DSM 18579]